jgi:hypothetical protein
METKENINNPADTKTSVNSQTIPNPLLLQISQKFIGLSKKSAQDLAERKDLIFRLISINGEPYFSYPEESDYRTDRICVELENSVVSKAVIM